MCALRSDGTSPHRGAAEVDGVVLSRARRRKEQRPRVGGSWQSRAPCYVGSGGGRQVVSRDAHVCGSVGKGPSPAGSTSLAEEG